MSTQHIELTEIHAGRLAVAISNEIARMMISLDGVPEGDAELVRGEIAADTEALMALGLSAADAEGMIQLAIALAPSF